MQDKQVGKGSASKGKASQTGKATQTGKEYRIEDVLNPGTVLQENILLKRVRVLSLGKASTKGGRGKVKGKVVQGKKQSKKDGTANSQEVRVCYLGQDRWIMCLYAAGDDMTRLPHATSALVDIHGLKPRVRQPRHVVLRLEHLVQYAFGTHR